MSEVDEQEQPPAVAAATMHGDLMSIVTDEIKALPDVWQKLGEAEQAQVIERVRKRTGEAIEECVRMIATHGFTRIRAKVDSVTIKDGIKAVLTMSAADPSRHELADAQGSRVYLVIADTDDFGGGTDSVKPDPNQGTLVLDSVKKIGDRPENKPDADGDGELT